MNIKNELRVALLENNVLESEQLLTEAGLMDIIDKLVIFIKKNWEKIKQQLINKKDYALQVIKNLIQAANDIASGKTSKKNPDYKEARKSVTNAFSDVGKLLAFLGINMFLNVIVPGLGAALGAATLYVRKKLPKQLHKLADFLTLAVEKANEKVEDKIEEFFNLFEDMSYFHVDDATMDEYTLGLTESTYFNNGKFNKNGANTIVSDGETIIDFGVGDIGSFELNGVSFNNALYLKGGYNAASKGAGYGRFGIEFIFSKLPKIENIVLECFDNVLGFWTKIGGEVVDTRKNGNGDNINTVMITRSKLQ